MTSLREFNAEPSEQFLKRCTKDKMLENVQSNSIVLTSNTTKVKENMVQVVKSQLIAKGILVKSKEARPRPKRNQPSLKEIIGICSDG